MHPFCYGFQPARTVEDRIHRRDHSQQDLRGANVRGRLLAPDMLLARLQCEAIRAVAFGIDRHADKAARHGAFMGVARRHISGVRPAVAHWYAISLHRPDGDVSTHFAWRLEQRQRQRIGSDRRNRTRSMQLGDRPGEIVAGAGDTRILKERAEHADGLKILKRVANDHAPAQRLCARLHDRNGLRQAVLIDEKGVGL